MKFKLSVVLFLFVVSVFMPAYAVNDYMDYVENSSLDIGGGFDFISRDVKRSAVKPFDPVYVSDGGQKVEYTLKYVESSQDLYEAMEIEADGSYDGLVTSVSARSKFVSETQINTYSMNFIVRVKVVNGTKRIPTKDYFLSSEAKKLLETDKSAMKDKFKLAYGDRYVSAITTGGEYIGIINIETSSVSDKKKLETDIKASGMNWSAHSSFKGAMDKVSKSHKVTVNNFIRGGKGIKSSNNVGDMIDTANKFSQLVLDAGVPLKVQLSPYTDFVEYSGSDATLSPEVRYALQDLNAAYVDYMVFKNDLNHMVSHTENYNWDGTSVVNIKKYLDATKTKMRDMQMLGEKLIKGTEKPKKPVFASLESFNSKFKLPLQKFSINIAKQSLNPFKKHTKGDTEMSGNTPKMTVSAEIKLADKGRKLNMTLSGEVVEGKHDWTTFEDSKTVKIFDRDVSTPGYIVVSVSPKSGSLSHKFGNDDHSWRTAKGNGLVKSFSGRGDTDGKDAGKLGAKDIHFSPVELVVDKDPALYKSSSVNHLTATHAVLKAKHAALTPQDKWFVGKHTAPAHINKTKKK